MNYPQYPVTINYVPRHISGQQNVSIAGVTQSMPTYTDGYYQAYMQYANISATGSTYTTALSNLLIVATASTTTDPGVLPFKTTW